MKSIGLGIVATLLVLGLLPLQLVAKARSHPSPAQPVHLVLDMDKQPKFKAQRETEMFADKRSMRPEVAGTVAREDMFVEAETADSVKGTRQIPFAGGALQIELSDPGTYAAVTMGRIRPEAMSDADFAAVKPPQNDVQINADTTFYVRKIPAQFEVSEDFLKRGEERFTIYCSPCHGLSGYGDGMVARHATALATTADAVAGWVNPQNLQEVKIIGRPDGNIFNTITNGVRTMPAYDKQVSVPDRWAIVAYLRALERSQNARPGDAAAAEATAKQAIATE